GWSRKPSTATTSGRRTICSRSIERVSQGFTRTPACDRLEKDRSIPLFSLRERPMSAEAPDRQQQKIQEFLKILPLTIEIAGLPPAEPGRHLNEGQMEARATSIRAAYKIARQIVLDAAK